MSVTQHACGGVCRSTHAGKVKPHTDLLHSTSELTNFAALWNGWTSWCHSTWPTAVAMTLWCSFSSSQTWCLLKQANQVVLKDLTRNSNYDIVVVPFNSQGSGPPSPPVAVYVGEAVPTGEPQAVEGQPVSSTEVRLHWKPPQQSQQNGDLLGYKVWGEENGRLCRATANSFYVNTSLRAERNELNPFMNTPLVSPRLFHRRGSVQTRPHWYSAGREHIRFRSL